MNSNSTSISMNSSVLTEVPTSASAQSSIQSARFWAYLFSDIFSLICTFFTLFFILTDRTLRRALSNHVIIILLIIGLIFELTNIPWSLYDDYNLVPLTTSTIFYQFWVFTGVFLSSVQIELFAWATIERHILIFHDQWVSTSKKRFFVHYFPIGAIIIYYLIYYVMVYFVPFCANSFEDLITSGVHIPCVFDHTVLGVWDLIFHQVVPTLIIVFFSVGLLVRSILQKNRLHQGINWRKHRKMIIQLLSISTIYIICNTPWTLVIFAFQYGLPANIARVALVYTRFLRNYVIFLFPFVCCLSLPELRKKFKQKLLCCRRTRRVGPTAIAMARIPDVGAN